MALQFRSVSSINSTSTGGGTTLNITAPSGVTDGDMLLMCVSSASAATVTTPAGWTLLQSNYLSAEGGSGNRIYVYSRTASSEPGSYTVTFSSAFSTGSIGIIAWYSDTATAIVVDVSDTALNTPATANHVAPTVTTTMPNTVLHCFYSVSDVVTGTPHSGMTERWDTTGAACNYLMTEAVAAIGATGTRTMTGSSQTSAAVTVAIAEDIAIPAAPTSLTATPVSQTQINLSWTDNSSDEDGFKVEWSPTGSGSWTLLTTTGANATTYNHTGLTANTTYFYRVSATNLAGDSSYATANATTLPNAPSAPSGLSATAVSSSQVNLAWTDNSSNETGFEVERSPNGSTGWTLIHTTAVNTVGYADTAAPEGTTSYYRVRAVNTGGNSSYTSTASALTYPAAPTSLVPTVNGSSQIDLDWIDNSSGETGFKVERSGDGLGSWSVIATLAANTLTYSNSGLTAGATWFYRVGAYNASGTSYSSVVNATVGGVQGSAGVRPWSIELYNRAFDTAAPTTLTLRPLRYSIKAIGGYEYAEIAIDGDPVELWEALRWLRYYVIIRNPYGTPVWCGIVTEATIDLGGISIGKTLDTMTNRIAVAYTYTNANGEPVRGTTAWADNDATQDKYGIIEYLESQGDMAEDEATALRDRALDIYGNPPTVVNVNEGPVGGMLRCKGLWDTLAWKLYNRPGGLEQYDQTGAYEHLLGWGFTSSTVAFNPWVDKIHTMNSRLTDLRENDYIVVTGASNGTNNDTHRVKTRASVEPESYTNTTISFDAADDIMDSAELLGFIESYELINVSGSAVGGNNRYYITKSDVGGDHITVNPSTVSTSGAGSTVTIEQGHSVELDTDLVAEYPSASVTVAALGGVLAQSFTLSVDDPFVVGEIFIRCKRVGNPVDSIKVILRADDSGEPDGSDIELCNILGSDLGDQMTWVRFQMANTTTLTYGTTYWLLVARTSTYSHENYYVVELNEDAGYSGGALKLWNGTGWVDRPVPPDGPATADMPFQIWSWRQTSLQISDMLTEANQLFDEFEVRTASAVYKRQFRDQDQTAKTEIEQLLAVGTANDKRYLARVTPERIAQIYEEPDANSNSDTMITIDGTLLDIAGNPLEDGRLPVGQWVQIAGVPVNVDEIEAISPIFIERAEWNVDGGKFSALETKGAPNPWEEVRIKDGAQTMAQRIKPHL